MRTEPRSAAKTSMNGSAAKHDVIVLLKQDHAKVKKLFSQFDKLAKQQEIEAKVNIANQICAELIAHTLAEEEIFYPAAREATHADDMLNEANVEHDSAKDLIAQIQSMDPADEMYDAKVTVLGEYIEHHVEEEEGEMFPKVREAKAREAKVLDLKEMGAMLNARKQELMAQLCPAGGEEVDTKQLARMIRGEHAH
jgi:hemerythrin superfamily protein